LAVHIEEECRLRVFENRVLRRIFGPKRDEVTQKRRRLRNDKLYALYSSPNIIQVIRSRRMRWAEHVAGMWIRKSAYMVLVGKPEGRNHLKDPGVGGRILTKWIFQKRDGGLDCIYLAQDRERWRALVKKRSFGFHKVPGIS
jgi:hypothetical protein